MKLVADRPSDRQTDRQTDIATYRTAIAAKKNIKIICDIVYNNIIASVKLVMN